ncbi:trans-aconitate 2-methyltransferase [Lentzea albidocapillata subsp. violacea]|uniref:Trans-aconitate 2-methyltransferase n=1 Tax=Lentzea albidocapillata subsp. violacea TaxID=128104 RepID=A0A1G9AR84_9PSEU|nr:trans-aconitate 2-methyltransferase [Lentzea albidocapillata]SDK29354.1 trans-aconitate 2-methyltransferase [Lentzea albidocapillata subsp. violacea]
MWDPAQYLAFADHRARPFYELVGRVRASEPRRVVDVGCGPGNLTSSLSARWPSAVVEAFDSSPEMVEAARAAGVDARVDDVTTWEPLPDTDVVVSNAVLQWVASHPSIVSKWAGALPPGAWLAFQVPGNYADASHRLIREVAGEGLAHVFRAEKPVLDPVEYADLLGDCAVTDVWETTYVQRLSGPDPVLEWVSGTALRPVRAALSSADWDAYVAELAPRLREAYPQRADGTTWFPFRRIFAVAQV